MVLRGLGEGGAHNLEGGYLHLHKMTELVALKCRLGGLAGWLGGAGSPNFYNEHYNRRLLHLAVYRWLFSYSSGQNAKPRLKDTRGQFTKAS